MLNLKKLVLVVMMVLVIVGLANAVFATDEFENILDDSLGNRLNSLTNNTANNNTANNALNNTTNNSMVNNLLSNNNTNRNTSSVYNNTSLPKAGSSDGITVIAVIAVFGVSAIYAYKKIRDYNIK